MLAQKISHHGPLSSVKNVKNISQGSVVTCLTCGGVFNDDVVANLLQSLMKEL